MNVKFHENHPVFNKKENIETIHTCRLIVEGPRVVLGFFDHGFSILKKTGGHFYISSIMINQLIEIHKREEMIEIFSEYVALLRLSKDYVKPIHNGIVL